MLEFDDVSNDQRKVIYQLRIDIIDAADLEEKITELRHGSFTDFVHQFVPPESVEEQWDVPALEEALKQDWGIELDLKTEIENAAAIGDQDVVERVIQAADEAYAAKVALAGADGFRSFARAVLLNSLDTYWREHISALDYLRQGIYLRSYAQKQPKQEYKREAFAMFGQMLDAVRDAVTRTLMNVKIQTQEEAEAERAAAMAELEAAAARQQAAAAAAGATATATAAAAASAAAGTTTGAAAAPAAPAGEVPRIGVGRNDPCPCGSGKKYKHCHGALT